MKNKFCYELENADVIFDPSGFSNSVRYGIPVSIRKFVS